MNRWTMLAHALVLATVTAAVLARHVPAAFGQSPGFYDEPWRKERLTINGIERRDIEGGLRLPQPLAPAQIDASPALDYIQHDGAHMLVRWRRDGTYLWLWAEGDGYRWVPGAEVEWREVAR